MGTFPGRLKGIHGQVARVMTRKVGLSSWSAYQMEQPGVSRISQGVVYNDTNSGTPSCLMVFRVPQNCAGEGGEDLRQPFFECHEDSLVVNCTLWTFDSLGTRWMSSTEK